ncbi:MAG: transporter substrate-binding domain-containing protein [Alphaproteobacteria bacterium]|nr:transporter substrate-binding domain-containing protein [Alphaproteobacteria bacterium]
MKIISMCVAVIAVFFIFSAPAAAQDPGQNCGMKKNGQNPFRIVGFKDYPPFSWAELDEQSYKDSGFKSYTYNGFILDPLKQSLEEIGIVRTKPVVFDRFNDALRAMLHGKADLLFTGYYIDESKSGLDYIYPAYFGNPFIVLSRKSKKIDVEDVSELKGMKGVVRREEEVESLIRGLLPTDTKLEVVDGPEAAFRMLLSGNADFMITSPYAADAEAKRFKIKDKLHFGSKVVRHIKYFLAFSKMSVCRIYKDKIAQKFNERFKNKAEIEKLIHKYIDIWVKLHADEPPLEYTPAADDQSAPAAAAQQPAAPAG